MYLYRGTTPTLEITVPPEITNITRINAYIVDSEDESVNFLNTPVINGNVRLDLSQDMLNTLHLGLLKIYLQIIFDTGTQEASTITNMFRARLLDVSKYEALLTEGGVTTEPYTIRVDSLIEIKGDAVESGVKDLNKLTGSIVIEGGDGVNVVTYAGKIIIVADHQVIQHNALSGRSANDAHNIESITGLSPELKRLSDAYDGVDDYVHAEVKQIHDDITRAYINTIAYPVINQVYNGKNTWITFDNKIYRCKPDVEEVVWTGVITSDWELVFMTNEEIHTYVQAQIQAAFEGEFPLQMRPDATFGIYQTKEELPLTDNEPGYLTIVINEPDNGIYIWGIDPLKTNEFTWLPFVVIAPITQDTLSVTFNENTKSLKETIIDIQAYIDAEVNAEALSRNAQYNGINTRVTSLESSALTLPDSEINALVFRGTQELFDTDPLKDKYFLALIVG